MALGVSAFIVIGDRLQGCNVNAPAAVARAAPFALVTILTIGAFAAGWWGSNGLGVLYGCLAGLGYGLLVAAALIVANIVDFGLMVSCLAPHLPELVRPQVTSMAIQGVVSFALEVVGLAALVGLLAGRYRGRRQS
jgi:hypothetical protein